jgi:hypothetical protein
VRVTGQDEFVDAEFVVLSDPLGNLLVAADQGRARAAPDEADARPQVGETSRVSVRPPCSAVIRRWPSD